MQDTMLKRIRCTNCGADFTNIAADQAILICNRAGCGASFSVWQGEAFAAVEKHRAEVIGNHRAELLRALSDRDLDSVSKFSSVILGMIPGDFRAEAARCMRLLKQVNGDPRPLRKFLESFPEGTEGEFLEMFPFLLDYCGYSELGKLETAAAHYLGVQSYSQVCTKIDQRRRQIVQRNDDYADIPRDVFVCHSSLDAEIAQTVCCNLRNDGWRVWISTNNLDPNSMFYWDDIGRAIKQCRIFLTLCSYHAMQSKDVQKEMQMAIMAKSIRLELKLDNMPHTELFKAFFNGISWIDATEGIWPAMQRLNLAIASMINPEFFSTEEERKKTEEKDMPKAQNAMRMESIEGEKKFKKEEEFGELEQYMRAAELYRKGAFSDSFKCLVPLAKKGYPDAQNLLGICFATGHGIKANEVSAFIWFMKAAKQGHEEARDNIVSKYKLIQYAPQHFIQQLREWRSTEWDTEKHFLLNGNVNIEPRSVWSAAGDDGQKEETSRFIQLLKNIETRKEGEEKKSTNGSGLLQNASNKLSSLDANHEKERHEPLTQELMSQLVGSEKAKAIHMGQETDAQNANVNSAKAPTVKRFSAPQYDPNREGCAVYLDGYVYYASGNFIKRMRPNGTDNRVFSKCKAISLYAAENHLFCVYRNIFSDCIGFLEVEEAPNESKKPEVIVRERASESNGSYSSLRYFNGKLYFKSHSGLRLVSLDGRNCEDVCIDSLLAAIFVAGNGLILVRRRDSIKIASLQRLGSKQPFFEGKFDTGIAGDCISFNDNTFCLNYSDTNQMDIRSMHMDDAEPTPTIRQAGGGSFVQKIIRSGDMIYVLKLQGCLYTLLVYSLRTMAPLYTHKLPQYYGRLTVIGDYFYYTSMENMATMRGRLDDGRIEKLP